MTKGSTTHGCFSNAQRARWFSFARQMLPSDTFSSMSERDEAIADLSEAGILDCFRWAWASVCLWLAEEYEPTTGLDQGWLGLSGHKLLKDRLDRVFRCRAYSVQDPDDDEAGLDVLLGGLFPGEASTLLQLRPGPVERADVTFSPGWRHGPWHWLLSAFPPGGIQKIDWRAKSPTKQRIAGQPSPEQFDLFTSHPDSEAVIAPSTLIVAHSYDGDLQSKELFLGSPTIDPNSENPWNWAVDLLDGWPDTGVSTIPTWPDLPQPPETDTVADAPVRLRANEDDRKQKDTT